MRYMYSLPLLLVVLWVFFIPITHQLQTSQTQVLLQLRKHLEFPPPLEILENYEGDLCYLPSSAHFSMACKDNSVTELKVLGDRHGPAQVSGFKGYAIPNLTLSESFSVDSFVTTLTRLTSLRVLSLVSLGVWGELPDKIHRLSSLEVLDLSSNFLYGSVPPEISRMEKLNILTLDGNYFNATMPNWFHSLTNLTILSLKNNCLNGSFPISVRRIKRLTHISFSQNELFGRLPDLSALTNLHVLDLRENHLDSELPVMPKGLVTILLSKNTFSGEIPGQIGELSQLQHLDLSSNHLSGLPPSALFSLPKISYLNVANNMLSGSLPNELNCGGKLGFVNISDNKLIGGLPSCLTNTSDKRVVEYGGNCLSVDSQNQNGKSYCKEATRWMKHSGGLKIIAIASIIGGFALFIVLLVVGGFWCRRHYSRKTHEKNFLPTLVQDSSKSGISLELLANARLISQAAKLGTQPSPICRTFSIEELKEATNNFNKSMFYGQGSIGELYRGKLENGTSIAIRILTLPKKYSNQNLKVRLDLLSKLHHPHLVGLMGHCIDDGRHDSSSQKVYLIYEYVPNGNYRDHLSETCPEKALKWSDRLTILIGVAKAVHFLHTGVIPGCFRNQLKTNNILLDEHNIAKLSDYGMSMIVDETIKLEVKGENPKSSQRTDLEDDVHSFGFILLESLVGPVVSGKGETFLLNEMASFGSQDGRRRIVDPMVLTTCSQESLSIAISITTKCISPEPSSRPSFEDVLWNLQYAAQAQSTADADQKSDFVS